MSGRAGQDEVPDLSVASVEREPPRPELSDWAVARQQGALQFRVAARGNASRGLSWVRGDCDGM